MPLKPITLFAAFFSSLVLLIAGYIALKMPAPQATRAALPPVEIAPPVRSVTPQSQEDLKQTPLQAPLSVKPDALLPKGVELIKNEAILNAQVRKTRERLVDAASSGSLNRLHIVFQMNETQPIFTKGQEKDPVVYWKKASGDGQGREILSSLSNIMALPAALINKGTMQEMYVWPYLAYLPLRNLSPAQEVELYKLVTAQDAKDMAALGKWVFWRVGIGKDGTLHYFVAGE